MFRDHHHLGKFHQESTCPRPILVKFNWTSEFASLLFRRDYRNHLISSKPDLTPPERHLEAALLKQHRSLVNTGLNKSCIQIRGKCIFVEGQLHVRGQLHAKYQDYQLDFSNPYSSAPLTSNQTSSTLETASIGLTGHSTSESTSPSSENSFPPTTSPPSMDQS